MLIPIRSAERATTRISTDRGKRSVDTGPRAAMNTPNTVAVLFFYLALLTFWVVAPCEAQTATSYTTTTYHIAH